MSESKIQPLVTLIRRGCQIFHSLILGHGIPLCGPGLVPPDVVNLRENVQCNVCNAKRDQDTVTALVPRSIICSVDVRSDDPTSLDEHVVQGRRDSPRTNCVRVAGVPCHLDRMRCPLLEKYTSVVRSVLTRRITEQQTHDTERLPFVDLCDVDLVEVD